MLIRIKTNKSEILTEKFNENEARSNSIDAEIIQ